jgi:hypothetical protein
MSILTLWSDREVVSSVPVNGFEDGDSGIAVKSCCRSRMLPPFPISARHFSANDIAYSASVNHELSASAQLWFKGDVVLK